MWSAQCCADDTRGDRLAASKTFDEDSLGQQTHGGKCLLHLCHEARRTAWVDLGVSRDAEFVEDRPRQMSSLVEVFALPVLRARPAVTDVAAAMHEKGHERADFGGERMMLAIASPVQPQNLPCRAG